MLSALCFLRRLDKRGTEGLHVAVVVGCLVCWFCFLFFRLFFPSPLTRS